MTKWKCGDVVFSWPTDFIYKKDSSEEIVRTAVVSKPKTQTTEEGVVTKRQLETLPLAKHVDFSRREFGFSLYSLDDRPGVFVESKMQRELLIPVDRHVRAVHLRKKLTLWLDQVVDTDALFEIAELRRNDAGSSYEKELLNRIFMWL